ncbi:MAG: hypothetical protein AAB420_03920 [Patescibacteria group bacterium]
MESRFGYWLERVLYAVSPKTKILGIKYWWIIDPKFDTAARILKPWW